MRKMKVWIFISGFFVLSLLIVISILIHWGLLTDVNSDFATEALLEYRCDGDMDISVNVNDKDDILILKRILKGNSTELSPSCGFYAVRITMFDDSNSIIFHPASDGCSVLKIGKSAKYIEISDSARRKLDEVLKKYGINPTGCR